MKYIYSNFKTFCIIGLLWCFSITTHSQDILWEKSYGGKHSEYLFDAQPTADYGFILAGSSLSNKTGNKTGENNGDLDYWVWKMDEKGELDWQKSFGGSGFDLLQSIKITRDGGFILGGTSSSNANFQKKTVAKAVLISGLLNSMPKAKNNGKKQLAVVVKMIYYVFSRPEMAVIC